MTSTPRTGLVLKRQRDDEAALLREFPDFEDVIRSAGPPPTDEKLEQLASERREHAPQPESEPEPVEATIEPPPEPLPAPPERDDDADVGVLFTPSVRRRRFGAE